MTCHTLHVPPSRRLAALLLVGAWAVAACDGDEPAADEESVDPGLPSATVAVPPERTSEFCRELVDLTDAVRNGELDDVEAAILETYRSVGDDVPDAIADDFDLVLGALEDGGPLPTDPPRPSVATTPGTEPSAATTAETGSTGPSEPEIGFAPADSPSERITTYVESVCRNTANNPGPPATQPGADPLVDDG